MSKKVLMQSIEVNGWTLPIVVRPDFTIIDGFHRWTVAGREPLRSKEYRRTRHEGTRLELENFFRSEWFKVLTTADGNYIIKMLRKEQAQ